MAFTTLITAEELHAQLDDAYLAIFDCRHALADFAHGRRLYDESHIPGSFFADVESDLAGPKNGTNGRHPLPDPESFVRFLRIRGVSDTTQIVAYDAGGDMFAPRFWFLTRYDHVSLVLKDAQRFSSAAAGWGTSNPLAREDKRRTSPRPRRS